MNYSLGKVDPTGNLAKCLKSGQNFSRSGRKKYSSAGTALLLKLLFAAACSNVQRAAIWFLAVLHSLPDLYYSIMQAQNSYWLDCSAVQPTCDSAMLLAAWWCVACGLTPRCTAHNRAIWSGWSSDLYCSTMPACRTEAWATSVLLPSEPVWLRPTMDYTNLGLIIQSMLAKSNTCSTAVFNWAAKWRADFLLLMLISFIM